MPQLPSRQFANTVAAKSNGDHLVPDTQRQERKAFMNWDANVACMARRAAPKRGDGVKPWVEGWNATLGIIEQHVKSLPLLQRTATT